MGRTMATVGCVIAIPHNNCAGAHSVANKAFRLAVCRPFSHCTNYRQLRSFLGPCCLGRKVRKILWNGIRRRSARSISGSCISLTANWAKGSRSHGQASEPAVQFFAAAHGFRWILNTWRCVRQQMISKVENILQFKADPDGRSHTQE